MASELRVNTLKDASGNNSIATSFVAGGSAKAWVLGDSAAGLTKSFNIASGTDNGTGDYTYALTSNMDSANFACSATGASGGRRYGINNARAAGTFQVRYYDDNELIADTVNSNSAHGDLA